MKTPAVYQNRLSFVLNICLKISAQKGFITASDLANELKVTVRAAREYLSDFTRLGMMYYDGGGRYIINKEMILPILHKVEAINGQLRIDDFIPQIFSYAAKNNAFFKKAFRVLEKVGYTVTHVENIRRLLISKNVPDNLKDIVMGDKLLYDKSYYEFELKGLANCKVVGEYSSYRLKNYLVADVLPLTVAYIASCACIIEFDVTEQPVSSKIIRRPSIKPFKNNEPYREEELLYELSVEYPELLMLGRKIAARFLKEQYRYKNLLEALNEENIALIVTHGTLKPHGFIISKRCDVLNRLLTEFEKLFKDFLSNVMKKGIIFVSIYEEPRDHRFFNLVRNFLGLKMQAMSDYAFLSSIMRDGDITSPIKVVKERGKEEENWYEFYLKRGEYLYKLEFITNEDPIKVQKKILSLMYPSFMISQGVPSLPMLIEAERACQLHLNWLEKNFELALRVAAKNFYEFSIRPRIELQKEVKYE